MMTETNPLHVLLACLNFVEIVERYPLCFTVFFFCEVNGGMELLLGGGLCC